MFDGDDSFRQLFTSIFTGNGTGHEDSGSFRYTCRTEKNADLAPVSKVTKVDKTAHITYATSTTWKAGMSLTPGTEIVHIDPDGGGDDDGGDEIIEEKDHDSPVLPGTPELPPVQDAKPDAPVLPADPALPAVQDAHALPQTGVNWLAAIGLALSGMTHDHWRVRQPDRQKRKALSRASPLSQTCVSLLCTAGQTEPERSG